MIVRGLVGNLQRPTSREWNDVVGAQFVRLETIMLDGIELLANRTRVDFAHISDSLEECAESLRTLGQALVNERLYAVVVQGVFVLELGIPVMLHTFDLAQIFGMCRVWPAQQF